MKKLFLTSSVNEVAHDLVKYCDLSKGNRLVFIDTAAEPSTSDKQWENDDRQALVDAGFEVTGYTITGKNKAQIEKDLEVYQYIYISGGNTFYLLQESQKSGFVDFIRKVIFEDNKTYISTSAGSIIAGPDTYPASILDKVEKAPDLKIFGGYNLVNFCVLPHWGSDYFREMYLNRRLELAYKKDQVPLIILTDTQYVLIEGDRYQIIDVNK